MKHNLEFDIDELLTLAVTIPVLVNRLTDQVMIRRGNDRDKEWLEVYYVENVKIILSLAGKFTRLVPPAYRDSIRFAINSLDEFSEAFGLPSILDVQLMRRSDDK